MGRSEECAGLTRLGYDPSTIAELIGISTQSVIDYLYRAIGKGYITTADIVLSIPGPIRQTADNVTEKLGTDDWYSVYMFLETSGESPHRDLLPLYLHIRGAIAGDFYYHVTEIEKLLYGLIKKNLNQDFTYWYFSDLVKAVKSAELNFLEILTPLGKDPIGPLDQACAIRNRVMHPTPPFTPTDDEYKFIRDLHRRLRHVGNPHLVDKYFDTKLRQSANAILAKNQASTKETSNHDNA
jgi:hypothetical protein